MELRYLSGVLKALNSRNMLARRCTRQLLVAPLVTNILGSDLLPLDATLRCYDLSISLPPHPTISPIIESTSLILPYTGAAVLLVSDGSSPDGRLGWGAVVADLSGSILGTTCGGAVVDIATSWAAEWCGKLAAVRLADALGIPGLARAWAIADNVSAALGPDGGRPSAALVVDNIRLAYAAAVSGTALHEGFTPAEHDTGWVHLIATLQARRHDLAAAGVHLALPRTAPFLDLHADHALLFHGGRLVLSLSATLDLLYARHHPPPIAALPLAGGHPQPLLRWAQVVESNVLRPGALRLAALLRAAPLFPVVLGHPFGGSLTRLFEPLTL